MVFMVAADLAISQETEIAPNFVENTKMKLSCICFGERKLK